MLHPVRTPINSRTAVNLRRCETALPPIHTGGKIRHPRKRKALLNDYPKEFNYGSCQGLCLPDLRAINRVGLGLPGSYLLFPGRIT